MPVPIAVAVMSGVLHGLHAAHEARDERGEPLGIVHRDVSPQNILVGTDGVARVLDFGVAKAAGRLQTTRDGQLKGKLAYMAPEQLCSEAVIAQADIYAASVVLWETLTGERLFSSESEGGLVTAVLMGKAQPPSRAVAKGSPPADDDTMGALERLDAVVLRGLERDPAKRFETAREMAIALEACVQQSTAAQVGEWLERIAGPVLAERAARVGAIEREGALAEPEGVEAVAPVEAPTQASSISVAKNAPRAEPGRGGRRAMVVFIAGAALAVLGVTLIVRSTRVPAPVEVAPPSVPAATPDLPASAAPVAPPSTAEAPTPPPPPVASASTPSRSTAVPRRAAPRPACNPPFTWDAQGKKHYKAECL